MELKVLEEGEAERSFTQWDKAYWCLVVLVGEQGELFFYTIAANSTGDAVRRTVIGHEKARKQSIVSHGVKLYMLGMPSDTIHDPMQVGAYSGQYLAEQALQKAYIDLMVVGDFFDSRGDVTARDVYYQKVPRDRVGNRAFRIHTGVERSPSTV